MCGHLNYNFINQFLKAVITVGPATMYSFVKKVCEQGEMVNTSVKLEIVQNYPFASLVCQTAETIKPGRG